MKKAYEKQVSLLLDILPYVFLDSRWAMHGGTAINLFVREMPRMSVDVDLTYLPIEDRDSSIAAITRSLDELRNILSLNFPLMHVTEPFKQEGQAKLFCSSHGVQVKIEVNTTMRGVLGEVTKRSLCTKAQNLFDKWLEATIVPIHQLYGGKICAAMDRQHPRDLFDVLYIINNEGFTFETKRGWLLYVLGSSRPIHELIMPNLLDQRRTMINHFDGMASEPFSYVDFETTRVEMMRLVRDNLTDDDKKLLIGFKSGDPEWGNFGYEGFNDFPSIQWKLKNIRFLKESNPQKHQTQLDALKKVLE